MCLHVLFILFFDSLNILSIHESLVPQLFYIKIQRKCSNSKPLVFLRHLDTVKINHNSVKQIRSQSIYPIYHSLICIQRFSNKNPNKIEFSCYVCSSYFFKGFPLYLKIFMNLVLQLFHENFGRVVRLKTGGLRAKANFLDASVSFSTSLINCGRLCLH